MSPQKSLYRGFREQQVSAPPTSAQSDDAQLARVPTHPSFALVKHLGHLWNREQVERVEPWELRFGLGVRNQAL